jgi:DNA-binding NarL/FixJ family response regulator
VKVLIADDSEVVRAGMKELVSALPFVDEVIEAADATEAVRLHGLFYPEVAILDIRMPGGGGMKALRRIKLNDPQAAVIMLTNYPYEEYRRQCVAAGANDFFDKSAEFKRVIDVLREWHAGHARNESKAIRIMAEDRLKGGTTNPYELG